MGFQEKAGKMACETGKGRRSPPHIPIISAGKNLFHIGRHVFYAKKSALYRIFIVAEWEIMVECG